MRMAIEAARMQDSLRMESPFFFESLYLFPPCWGGNHAGWFLRLLRQLATDEKKPWPRSLRSDGEKAVEERSVASHRLPQVLCRDLVAAVPLRFESRALSREDLGKALHCLGDKLVGRLNGGPRRVFQTRLGFYSPPAGPRTA